MLKRVVQFGATTESFFWCSAKRYVQDAAAALQVIGQSHKCKMGRHTWHDGHWSDSARRRPGTGRERNSRLQERLETVVDVVLDGPDILYATKTVASFMQSPTKSAMAKLKRKVHYLLVFPQVEGVLVRRSTWVCTATETGQATRSGNARPLELQRSSELTRSTLRPRRNRWSRCPARRRSCTLATASGVQTCHFLIEAGYEVFSLAWSDSSAQH